MIKDFIKLSLIRFKLRKVKYTNLTSRVFIGKNANILTDDNSHINFNEHLAVSSYVLLKATHSSNISFGQRVYIGDYSILHSSYADIIIGSDTMIAQQVKLISTNHYYKDKNKVISQQHIDTEKKGITIGEDCWLGAGCAVMPGVTLGKGVVVGTNAVVTKDVPDYAVVVGIPAKIISYRV